MIFMLNKQMAKVNEIWMACNILEIFFTEKFSDLISL